MDTGEISKGLIHNTVIVSVGTLVTSGVGLFLTAYKVSVLGLEQYGIFILLEILVSSCVLLDVGGVNGAVVKYVAEFNTRKEYRQLRQIVNLGFFYYLSFWGVVAVGVYLANEWLFRIFKFPDSSYQDYKRLLAGFLALTVVGGCFSVFRSVLIGFQRLDITTGITIAGTAVNIAGTWYALSHGYGLVGLVANYVAVTAVTAVLQTVAAVRLLPGFSINMFDFDRALFRKSFAFGMSIHVARFAELINLYTDRILIGRFVGMGPVGSYDLGSKLAKMGKLLPEQLLPAIFPAVSHLDADNDSSRVTELYFRGSKYCALLTCGALLFLAIHAREVLTFWVRSSTNNQAVLAMQFLCAGNGVLMLSNVGRLIGRGLGVPRFEMQASIVMAVVNLLLSILLIIQFGFIGTLGGTLAAACISSMYFLFRFHRHTGYSFIRQIAFPVYSRLAVAGLFAAAGSIFAGALFEKIAPDFTSVRLESFLFLLAAGTVYILLFGGILFVTGFFDKYDGVIIKKVIHFGKKS